MATTTINKKEYEYLKKVDEKITRLEVDVPTKDELDEIKKIEKKFLLGKMKFNSENKFLAGQKK